MFTVRRRESRTHPGRGRAGCGVLDDGREPGTATRESHPLAGDDHQGNVVLDVGRRLSTAEGCPRVDHPVTLVRHPRLLAAGARGRPMVHPPFSWSSPNHCFPHASRKHASRFGRSAMDPVDTEQPLESRTSRRLDASVWKSTGKTVRLGISRVRCSSSGTWASQSPGNLVSPDHQFQPSQSGDMDQQVQRQFRPTGRDFQPGGKKGRTSGSVSRNVSRRNPGAWPKSPVANVGMDAVPHSEVSVEGRVRE